MITRRILVTTVVNAMGQEKEIFGRFDAVALAAAGWKLSDSQFRHYKMTEETFAKNATLIKSSEE